MTYLILATDVFLIFLSFYLVLIFILFFVKVFLLSVLLLFLLTLCRTRLGSAPTQTLQCQNHGERQKPKLTLIFVLVHAVHLSVRVGGFAVLGVVSVQVRELRQQIEHALPITVQVRHFTVEKIETLQMVEFFLNITGSASIRKQASQESSSKLAFY